MVLFCWHLEDIDGLISHTDIVVEGIFWSDSWYIECVSDDATTSLVDISMFIIFWIYPDFDNTSLYLEWCEGIARIRELYNSHEEL